MDPKKHLVVFDIDGTLTDTVTIHQAAFKDALRNIGVTSFNDRFGSYRHHTDYHIAKEIYESGTGGQFDPVVATRFEQHLFQYISRHQVQEIAGAAYMVHHLTATGFGICYATGSLLRPAAWKLEQIAINFDRRQLVASNAIEERETIVTQAISSAQQHYQVEDFEKIVLLGDGLWDLLTAQKLGLDFVGIGNIHEETLRKHGMQRHFADFAGLTAEALLQ